MPIRIVTDSACDIPQNLVKEYDITVVPLYINIGEKSLLDGVELSRDEFYTNLPNYLSTQPLPHQALVSSKKFMKNW